MKQKRQSYLIFATALILIFLGASCSKNNGAEAPPVIPGPTTDVKITSNATFGNIMTDGDSKTLYSSLSMVTEILDVLVVV